MALSFRTRLFVPVSLESGKTISLNPEQLHYLRNVLRLTPGVEIAVFNGQDGEWRSRIQILNKSDGQLQLEEQVRAQTIVEDLWLLFAPIKRDAIDLLVEKTTELGVGRLMPVITRHTDVTRVNLDRLRANVVEAAQQSERLSVPVVCEPQDLADVINQWPSDRILFVCAESGENRTPLLQTFAETPGCKAAILIGPEGGFARSEIDFLQQLQYVRLVQMGPRVLRAETAALAAVACWQAQRGDW